MGIGYNWGGKGVIERRACCTKDYICCEECISVVC